MPLLRVVPSDGGAGSSTSPGEIFVTAGFYTTGPADPSWLLMIQSIAVHPAIERPIAHALESKEQAQRNDLTGPEAGQGMFRRVYHRLVSPVEQH
jgi:hypothetical protein